MKPNQLDIKAAERFFRDRFLSASRHQIPAGRHRFLVHALNDYTKKLAQQRDSIRIIPSDLPLNNLNRGIMAKTAKEKEKNLESVKIFQWL